MNEDKASRYHRLRRRADLLGTAAAGAVLLALLLTGWSLQLRELGSVLGMTIERGYEEPGTVVGFTIGLFLLMQLIELPFSYYQGYLLERRYDLSTQSLRHWALDYAKAAALGLVFAVVGVSIVYWTIRDTGPWWWVVSAGVFAVLTIGIVQLAPVVVLPLFYTFTPLERPQLVSRLLALAERAGSRAVGVYEWALSAHTRKANAALAGIGRTRRILLSDTLLSGYTDDEIEVILAHELSHHVHHDLWRGIALQTVCLVAGFFVAHLALVALADRLALRGIDDPAGLPLLLLVGGLCSLAFQPLANALSRAHERRADRYALETTGQPAAFISAMRRLSQQNLAEEFPSALVQWVFYSHPPIRTRIEAARAWAERDAGGEVPAEVSQPYAKVPQR